MDDKKQRNDQIKILVDIVCNFFNSSKWVADKKARRIIILSPLLPLLESAFRNGSWLDMAKEAPVYQSYLALTRSLSTQDALLPCLVALKKKYKPNQTTAIHVLLGKLNELASIFIQCLDQQQSASEADQAPERLAKDVIKTHNQVQLAIEDILADKMNDDNIADALLLPIDKQYRTLLQDLRFDYMDMKTNSEYVHHYKSNANQN